MLTTDPIGAPVVPVSPQSTRPAALSRRWLLGRAALGLGLAAAGLALSACGASSAPTTSAPGTSSASAAGSATSGAAAATASAATSSAAASAATSSSASAAPAPASGAAGAAASIQWSTWNTGGLLTNDKTWIDDFQKANPGIKVEVINSPSDYAAKLLSEAAAGALPDVMHLAADEYPSMVQANLLLDVTSYFDQSHFDASKYLPFSDIFKPGGRIMGGLEDYSKDYPLFYNATLFKKANLSTPYDLYKQNKWTWDAFTSSAAALTKDGVYGANSYDSWETGWTPWVYAAGATDWIAPKPGLAAATVKLDSAGVKQATEFLVGLIFDKKVAPKPGTITTVGSADAFTGGKVAMMSNGNWVLADYPKLIGSRFEWGIAPVPTPSGSNYLSMFNPAGHGMVGAHSKQPEAAVKLAQFFLGDEVQNSLAQNPTLLPMLRSAYTAAANAQIAEQHFDVTQYLLEHSSPIPVFTKFDQTVAKIQSDLDNAFLGKVSADQALTSAQQNAQQIAAGTGS